MPEPTDDRAKNEAKPAPQPNGRSVTPEDGFHQFDQMGNDPATPSSWTRAAIATSASKTISNLISGKRYWFRVAAVGAGAESGWSEHATKVVP